MAVEVGHPVRTAHGDERGHRHLAQALRRLRGGAADGGRELGAELLSGRQGWLDEGVGPALDDGSLEQPIGQRRGEVGVDAQAARRLAEDRDPVRVPAEPGDVVLHPLQRQLLVHQAVVARAAVGGLRAQRRVGEEARRAQSVVDGHDDHVAVDDEPGRVEVVALADRQRTTVDPDHDGEPAPLTSVPVGRCVHVEVETVLGQAGRAERRRPLRAVRTELRRVVWGRPRLGRHGRLPAMLPNWCRAVADAEELAQLGVATPRTGPCCVMTSGRPEGRSAGPAVPVWVPAGPARTPRATPTLDQGDDQPATLVLRSHASPWRVVLARRR